MTIAANHGFNLDLAAITDSLRDAMLATEQMALALKEGSSVGLKLAAEQCARHANRVAITSNSLETRVAARMNRQART